MDNEILTDLEITELYFVYDEFAREAATQRYSGILSKICMNILADTPLVRKCVAEVFDNAEKQIPKDMPKQLLPFLGRQTKNLALNILQTDITKNFSSILSELSELSGKPSENTVDIVNEFIESLTKNEKQLFVRRYWYGDSISFLAEEFKCKEDKLTKILIRLRSKLKEKLLSASCGLGTDDIEVFRTINNIDGKIIIETEIIDPMPNNRRYQIFMVSSLILAAAVIIFMAFWPFGDSDSVPSAGTTQLTLSMSSLAFSAETGAVFAKQEYISVSDLISPRSREQVFKDHNSFEGIILDAYNVEVFRLGNSYYQSAIMEIEVTKAINGNMPVGEVIKILLPLPIIKTGDIIELSVEETDMISEMRIGQKGIFFLNELGTDTLNSDYLEKGQDKFYFKDIADARFLDGMRYVILKAGNGILLNTDAFEQIGAQDITDAKSLEQAAHCILAE